MKKIASVAVVVLLVFSLVACSGGSDPIQGEWKLSSIGTMGIEFTLEEITQMLGNEAMGDVKLTVNKDGTFSMDMLDPATGDVTTGEGTWTKDGESYILAAEGDNISATLAEDGKTLTLEADGTTMKFTK